MVSIKLNNKKKKYIFEAIYIAIFIVIAVFVGVHHEHWADEAQSWLIARDNDVVGIFKAIRYEGTPALWQLLLKVCIVCGMKYNQLYILTTTLTVIGIIFLHKNENVPIAFKILLPYTYYIFFQYTIVARSYTLLFPILMIIAYIYPNKKEHLVQYGVLLTLLMSVSLHGFLLAGGFWFEMLVNEFLKNKEDIRKIPTEIKKFLIILAVMFVVVTIITFPAFDCSYGFGSTLEWYNSISGVLFTSSKNIITNIIGVILFCIVCLRLFDKENIITTISLSILNILWIAFIHGNVWHIGILFLIILEIAIINNKLKTDKILFWLLMISILLQIWWNISAIVYDIKEPYASGKAVSEYLKELDIEDKKVVGIDFWSIQVNPYFDKNIYSNYTKPYYFWNIDESKKTVSYFLAEKIEIDADIYVIPFYYVCDTTWGKKWKATEVTLYEQELIKRIEETGKYEKKEFDSMMYFKNCEHESTTLLVYSKK